MTTFDAAPQRISIRPLALPSEHGAWGLLLEPIVLAMIVAPSLAGLFVAIGAVALFLMRHPLKLGAIDGLKHRRYPRTAMCELLVVGYGLAASLAFAMAWALAGAKPLMLLATALPVAAVQFTYDVTSSIPPRIANAAIR